MQNNTFPTLFLGQNVIRLSSIDSTNNYLKELLSNSAPLPEGTVIMAEDQFAGRGQQQNSWQAEPGKNLTFSIYLRPVFLSATRQFYLSMVISLGIVNALKRYLSTGLSIKWPNDIFYGNKKLGGILMENIISGNHLKQTIAGIGLNVNQLSFKGEVQETAISIAQILQANVDITGILAEICKEAEVAYLKLKAGNYNSLSKDYVNNLYKLGEKAFYRQNGEIFEGTIAGVEENGQLRLERDGNTILYNFKEIEFIN